MDPKARASISSAGKCASRCRVRCSARTTCTTCSLRLRLRLSTALPRPKSPKLCRPCSPPTSADRSSKWVTSRCCTIATIQVRRRLWLRWILWLPCPARRRIVVAGEMLELGATGEQLHRECGRIAGIAREQAGSKLDFLLGVRGLAKPMVEAAREAGMKAEFVATPEEAGEWLARETREGDVVLLKASRGVKLEKALETWQRKSGIPCAWRLRQLVSEADCLRVTCDLCVLCGRELKPEPQGTQRCTGIHRG